MNGLINVQAGMSRKLHRGQLSLKKHSPELFLAAALVTGLTTLYFTAKAARKIDAVTEEVKNELSVVEAMEKNTPDYPVQEELGKVYIRAGVEYAKLLAPAVGAGVLTIGLVLGSHRIMHNRQVGLIAAYNGLSMAYKSYRQNVIKELGVEADRQYRLGAFVDSEEVVEEDGTKTTQSVLRIDEHGKSPYARFFDESCNGWRPDMDTNLLFIKAQQNLANDMLHWDGHIFLNDVYKLLGMAPTPEGQLLGWMYDEDGKNKEGDNCVDFDVFELRRGKLVPKPAIRDRNILIDFNVDGVIYDKIG